MDAILAPGSLAAELVAESLSWATRRAYRGAWRRFVTWCEDAERLPRPARPETVAVYLARLVELGLHVSTLNTAAAAIALAHRSAGIPSPTEASVVRAVLRGARRRIGVAALHPKAALRAAGLAEVLQPGAPGRGTAAKRTRDRALILVGWCAALRRSELVALRWEDVELRAGDGLALRIRRSKTDVDGAGRLVPVPYARGELCPVAALDAWRVLLGASSGPIFRPVDRHGRIGVGQLGDRAVAELLRAAGRELGLDLSGHSLRVGFISEAAARGVEERAIMRISGHRSLVQVRRYIRDGGLFTDAPRLL